MTEYLKKSFTVRFHTPAAKEKCAHCGTALETVIYRLNREPRCQDCFKDPRRVLSTNNNQPTSKGTDDGI